jgi:predicted Zn-dependent peptidase
MSEPRVTTLANGLRIVSEDSAQLETSSVGIWVDTGARNEASAINGISHVLEHMAFKGTTSRSARRIAEEIESVGGHLNAYTSREQTAYYARILKDDVPLAVDLLADILQRSVFEPTELSREQQVIIQEIGQTNDTPDDLIFDHFQETAFPGQAVGRSILGTPDRVSSFTREDLNTYLRRQYQAPHMVLAAPGRVDHDRLVELAERAFSALPGGDIATPEGARYHGGERRENRDLEQVHLVIGFNGIAYQHPDYYVAQVFSTVLGGGMSSRLFQEVRENRGLCYAIYSFAASFVDGGVFGIYAGTGDDRLGELIPAVAGELAALTEPPPAAEVERAKAQLKAGLLMALESPSARSEQFARQTLIFGRVLPNAEIVAQIDAVDAAALARFGGRLLREGRPTLAALGPVAQLEGYDAFAARFGG